MIRHWFPLSIPVSEEMSEEDKLALMFSYMSGRAGNQGLLHHCLQRSAPCSPLLSKNGIVSLYFDDSLKNYDKENELRISGGNHMGSYAVS